MPTIERSTFKVYDNLKTRVDRSIFFSYFLYRIPAARRLSGSDEIDHHQLLGGLGRVRFEVVFIGMYRVTVLNR